MVYAEFYHVLSGVIPILLTDLKSIYTQPGFASDCTCISVKMILDMDATRQLSISKGDHLQFILF